MAAELSAEGGYAAAFDENRPGSEVRRMMCLSSDKRLNLLFPTSQRPHLTRWLQAISLNQFCYATVIPVSCFCFIPLSYILSFFDAGCLPPDARKKVKKERRFV